MNRNYANSFVLRFGEQCQIHKYKVDIIEFTTNTFTIFVKTKPKIAKTSKNMKQNTRTHTNMQCMPIGLCKEKDFLLKNTNTQIYIRKDLCKMSKNAIWNTLTILKIK